MRDGELDEVTARMCSGVERNSTWSAGMLSPKVARPPPTYVVSLLASVPDMVAAAATNAAAIRVPSSSCAWRSISSFSVALSDGVAAVGSATKFVFWRE